MDKQKKQEILNNLALFTGTENYHRHMGNIIITDGAKFFAENCAAFWLLDLIFSVQTISEVRNQEMQVCKLKMTSESTATVTIEDGNDNVLYTQEIPFTDFPLNEITLWANMNDRHRVILLPSEY
ncbi:MAG TPA: hypothetical protein VNZ49_11945 [Bacteroidia bacterium]|jgi:hypothetical protein|nr:hypothetical protein [Bacteroidia bacterium]